MTKAELEQKLEFWRQQAGLREAQRDEALFKLKEAEGRLREVEAELKRLQGKVKCDHCGEERSEICEWGECGGEEGWEG